MPLMFLNGGAMQGGPLHHLLDGAHYLGVVRTAPRYRFFVVDGRFPALQAAEKAGARIAGELYDLTWVVLRDKLLPAEPAELELGVIELEDGTGSFAMLRRTPFTETAAYLDITDLGSWRAYSGEG